jgi:hypothetical protein
MPLQMRSLSKKMTPLSPAFHELSTQYITDHMSAVNKELVRDRWDDLTRSFFITVPYLVQLVNHIGTLANSIDSAFESF